MPKIKIPEMEVNTEDFGFPSSATPSPEEVSARIVKLNEQVGFWQEKANKVQALHEKTKEDQRKLKEMECALLLDGAVRDFKISRHEVAFFSDMYQKDPMRVKEHLEGMAARDYLKREDGLRGDESAPPDPMIELSVKALELRANDKSLDEAGAVRLAYKRNPGLFERVREARRENGAEKGVGK